MTSMISPKKGKAPGLIQVLQIHFITIPLYLKIVSPRNSLFTVFYSKDRRNNVFCQEMKPDSWEFLQYPEDTKMAAHSKQI